MASRMDGLDLWYGGAAHNELQLPMDYMGLYDRIDAYWQRQAGCRLLSESACRDVYAAPWFETTCLLRQPQ